MKAWESLVLGAIALVRITVATAPGALADELDDSRSPTTIQASEPPDTCETVPPSPAASEGELGSLEVPADLAKRLASEPAFCVVVTVDEGDIGFEDRGYCIVNFCADYPTPYVDEGPSVQIEVWQGDEQVASVPP